MTDKKVNVNVSIDNSEPATFVDRAVVSHSNEKFVLDFTQTTPRFDVIGEGIQQSITIKHKTLVMDPKTVKDFASILKENIEKFEKQNGKIAMPKPAKVKKEKKSLSVSDSSTKYIG